MPAARKRLLKSAEAGNDSSSPHNESATVVWGPVLEKNDFIKVPRTLVHLGQYASGVDPKIRLAPRHIVLVLALAGRRYKSKSLRVYWEELASYIGAKKETVRKWAYELRDMGLLQIKQRRGRDPEKNRVGYRNEANVFDLEPFVEFVTKAKTIRDRDRANRANKIGAEEH